MATSEYIDPKAAAALQTLHDLTAQNYPESAGEAWYAFVETLLYIAGVNAGPARIRVLLARALSANDMDPREFGL